MLIGIITLTFILIFFAKLLISPQLSIFFFSYMYTIIVYYHILRCCVCIRITTCDIYVGIWIVHFPFRFSFLDKHWSCDLCGKWYKHRDSLRRHTRDECGKKPRHQCNICHAFFYHRHNLKTHSISKHKVLI